VDADSFAEAAVAEHLRLVQVVFLVTGDRGLAEEGAQEALLRAWERVDRGIPLDSLTAWTTTVALNWCRTQLRRRGAESRALRRLRPTERSVDPPGLPMAPDVHQAILRLPFRQREVVVLHYLLDQDVATVARTAGVSTGAVKNALFHARLALARHLGVDADPVDVPAPAPTAPAEEAP
jgi:RNA polymerase sigma-70 factor (ECF subfamily)